jgi:DNA-binding NarL/FixJ family response regulator
MATEPTVVIAGESAEIAEVWSVLRAAGLTVAVHGTDRETRRPHAGGRREAGGGTALGAVAPTSAELIPARIRALREDPRVDRVVVLSHDHDPVSLIAAVAAGADGWVRPDMPPASLRRAVVAIHDGESGFSRRHVGFLVDALRLAGSAPEPGSTAGPNGDNPDPVGTPELTPREREIFTDLTGGRSTKEIAARLAVSEATVRWHSARLRRKMAAAPVAPGPARGASAGPDEELPRRGGHVPSIPEQRRSVAPVSVQRWSTLGRAELRVAMLVADGLTNQEIADRLYVSKHTVDSHLKHAFAKLQVRSRVDLTRLVLALDAADAQP